MSTNRATQQTMAAVRAMAPAISARSDEIEQRRRLPLDLVDELKAAGCFRLVVPSSYGGAGGDLATHLQMIRELARADGSVGWTVMIGTATPFVLGLLPRATLDAIYAGGPDVIAAGAFNPSGFATPVEGGYRVKGRWSFASGCQHADWFYAHCVVPDGRMPPVRMMILPAADVQIEDTWHVAGLSGSGSHHFHIDDVFVPEDRSFTIEDHSQFDGPLFRIPELSVTSLHIANVALGLAEAATAELTALAAAKTPAFSDRALGANPYFQAQIGEIDTLLRATRTMLDSEAHSLWCAAPAPGGSEISVTQRARVRGTAMWCTDTAATVVNRCHRGAGGSALFNSTPLSRRFRDVHAVTQHFAVKPDTATLVGAILCDQPADVTFL